MSESNFIQHIQHIRERVGLMKVTFFPCACISSERVKFCVRMEGSTINNCVNMAAVVSSVEANYYSIRRAREGSITTQKRA